MRGRGRVRVRVGVRGSRGRVEGIREAAADVQPDHAAHVALHRRAALDLAEQLDVRTEGVAATPGLLEAAHDPLQRATL